MMKKAYIHPQTEVILMTQSTMLCGSSTPVQSVSNDEGFTLDGLDEDDR